MKGIYTLKISYVKTNHYKQFHENIMAVSDRWMTFLCIICFIFTLNGNSSHRTEIALTNWLDIFVVAITIK